MSLVLSRPQFDDLPLQILQPGIWIGSLLLRDKGPNAFLRFSLDLGCHGGYIGLDLGLYFGVDLPRRFGVLLA